MACGVSVGCMPCAAASLWACASMSGETSAPSTSRPAIEQRHQQAAGAACQIERRFAEAFDRGPVERELGRFGLD